MIAAAPLCAIAVAAVWGGVVGLSSASPAPIQAQSNETSVWLVEIGAQTSSEDSGPAPVGLLLPAIAPLATPDRPLGSAAVAATVRLSDLGWIGEPSDASLPNAAYPPRLAEPPTLERTMPVYPDAGRRMAVSAGEVRLLNGDGRLDALAGDWSVAGQRVVLRRGPHRRPLHAAFAGFTQVATLRAASAAAGTSRLTIALRPAAADLDLPVCGTYAGTGGAEGPSALTGQSKPRLYGIKRNVEPVLVDPGLLLYQFHDGPASAVLAVRDRGMALTDAGNLASYAALAAASVSSGTYKTCLAAGLLRVGATPSSLTLDARGDNAAGTGGYNAGSAASIAQKLLQGPGGIATATSGAFAWPPGEAGLWLTSGTVAQALEALASGVFGWWGTDSAGRYLGGVLAAPETEAPPLSIEPWMLAAPPEEVGSLRAPWWRARVGYQVLGRVQADEQLAPAVSATDRAYYSTAWRLAPAYDGAISAAYPLAEDGPELASAFDQQSDAQALADVLLALFGRPRRMFLARVRAGAGNLAWPTLAMGACVSLRWPSHRALATGRPLRVVGLSARGDATTLTLWG